LRNKDQTQDQKPNLNPEDTEGEQRAQRNTKDSEQPQIMRGKIRRLGCFLCCGPGGTLFGQRNELGDFSYGRGRSCVAGFADEHFQQFGKAYQFLPSADGTRVTASRSYEFTINAKHCVSQGNKGGARCLHRDRHGTSPHGNTINMQSACRSSLLIKLLF
jgi:hypothetical protein